VGLGLFLAGFSLRRVAKRTLGKSYSYVLETLQKDKALVTHGIYKIIRHPIYLGSILYTLGTPLFFSSVYGFVMILGFIPCILYRIGIEEKILVQEFGNRYLEYQKYTKKLIPYVY
jgi:protein-S-isoprenylcysteine O-methyltransferase Ste14